MMTVDSSEIDNPPCEVDPCLEGGGFLAVNHPQVSRSLPNPPAPQGQVAGNRYYHGFWRSLCEDCC